MAGLGERQLAPPALDAAKVEARLARLEPRLHALIRRAGDALAADDTRGAQAALAAALEIGPSQPDVLRLHALLLARVGNCRAAIANFEAALHAAPNDAVTFWQYAHTFEESGDVAAALRLRRLAIERLPGSPLAWIDLGEHLFAHAGARAAISPFERAVQLAPDYAHGFLKLGSAYVECGRTADGTRMLRRALEVDPAFAPAWIALLDVKTVPLSGAELDRMRGLLSSTSVFTAGERIAVEFAFALACERQRRYAEAWQLLVDANARRKRELPAWDVERFTLQERRSDEIFSQAPIQALDSTLGRDVIFVVGLPRSGTTLVEQVLGSHPDVQAAGELAALPQVLTEESTRRRQRYPEWVPAASSADWQRLGQRYLEMTRGFRQHRPRSTDKLPSNWRALGAIRAMLPGARIVICRRDPLENCWSCFKQYFPDGWEFTSDIGHLGLFWKAFDHAAAQWARRAPGNVREQGYEALSVNPEPEIRALLDFCGLPFDPACLRPHELHRSIHTLSAAQVREPIHPHRTVAAGYGALLDPLRRALDMPAWVDAATARSNP